MPQSRIALTSSLKDMYKKKYDLIKNSKVLASKQKRTLHDWIIITDT